MTAPSLLVIALSDSFAHAWPPLAAEAGLALRIAGTVEPGASGEHAAVLVAAGGAEEQAPDVVSVLARSGSAPAVVGARPEHRLALALVASGAADYFALPGDLPELRRWIVARGTDARRSSAPPASDAFAPLVGRSAAMRELLARARRTASHAEATVLLTGETGTGKGVLAEALHRAGRRAAAPFVDVNCAALPASLLEAELFGHEKGAFTDARAAKPGLVEHADGGTLFLDEIGELPLALQGKLLTVLERRRLRRLGGLAERTVDVRMMAATHVDLVQAVEARRFRADLYFRLAVVTLHVPALREREADVVLLADHFGSALAAQHGARRPALTLADEAAILGYGWPGNVRELRNAVERALVCGEPLRLHVPSASRIAGGASGPASGPGGRSDELARVAVRFPATLRAMEREAVLAMIAHHAGNKSRAAHALGISRKRLYALLAN